MGRLQAAGNKVFDKNGKEFDNIDQNRLVAIEDIRKIINTFSGRKARITGLQNQFGQLQ